MKTLTESYSNKTLAAWLKRAFVCRQE